MRRSTCRGQVFARIPGFCSLQRRDAADLFICGPQKLQDSVQSLHGSTSGRSKLHFAAMAAAAAASVTASSLLLGTAVSSRNCRVDARQSFAHCAEPIVRRVAVARADSMADGEMRQVRIESSPESAVGEGAILLARIDGQFYATGASCSHYSAPLVDGVLSRDCMHVVCPWHDAAFDIRTGQPVRGCGLQAIPTYRVMVEGGEVIVDLPRDVLDFVAPRATRRLADDKRTFIIVGGGAAGVVAADALRQEGFTGEVLLLSEEMYLPYDRPVLSKNFAKAVDVESLSLRDASHFENHDITVRLNSKVKMLDAENHVVTLASGEQLHYDCALVATGSRARTLQVSGSDLPFVLLLRTPEDARKISARCGTGKRVVVIGSSFIGMEVAATLRRRGCEVTVCGRDAVPFQKVLGRRLGEALRVFFESKGVKFMAEAALAEIRGGNDGGEVVLIDGQRLPCDALVVGIGTAPNAEFVHGVAKAADGSLLADEYLCTNAPGLFAAGDVVTYRSQRKKEQRSEHWDVAMSQGRIAAKNMLGQQQCFEATPFFWTSIFGKNLRYVGFCPEFDELLVDGDLQKLNFVAYYCFQGAVCAVATMNRDPIAVAAGELMRMGRMPSVAALKASVGNPTSGLLAQLRQLCNSDAGSHLQTSSPRQTPDL